MHRQLKDSIKARATHQRWMEELPFVLLGLRTSWRLEPDCSPAELVYGQALTVPGQFLASPDKQVAPTSSFLKNLQDTVRNLAPAPTVRHGQHPVQVPASLFDAEYVFVRKDGYKQPLTRPYAGPYKVIKSGQKFFTLDLDGKQDKVSTDRLKRAHLPASWALPRCQVSPAVKQQPPPVPKPTPPTTQKQSQNTTVIKTSRFGRPLRVPHRLRSS